MNTLEQIVIRDGDVFALTGTGDNELRGAATKLLRQFLALDGFDAVIAANRAEIVAALRRPRRPDVVPLDGALPDADGLDVLAKIRKQPALRYVPVIMLTAKTTRESVLRGLAGGADGSITKPFEVDVLAKAVGTALGIAV